MNETLIKSETRTEWQVKVEVKVASHQVVEWREITVSAGNEFFANKTAAMFNSSGQDYRNAYVEWRHVTVQCDPWEKA